MERFPHLADASCLPPSTSLGRRSSLSNRKAQPLMHSVQGTMQSSNLKKIELAAAAVAVVVNYLFCQY
jgi:hypothetical protein